MTSSKPSNLRPQKKIPIFVEEDHNDVLCHIFRSVGAKYLPISGNVLIHFDSHPDLALPFRLNHKDTEIISDLYDKLSIESWILPAAYLGVIDKIVWICPPWSHQIPEGEFRFWIGKHKETGQVLTTCSESYFLSEGITCDFADLDNPKEVILVVYRLGFDGANKKSLNRVVEMVDSSPYILDIDLDFYSTKNPFLDLFPESGLYSKLKKIYTFESVPKHLSENEKRKFAIQSSQKRNQLLDQMVDLTNYLQSNRSVEGYSGIGTDYCDQLKEIQAAIVEAYGNESDIDWPIVHNAGCTCDDTELPHHVSSRDEIASLMTSSKDLLEQIGGKITVVTVARSSLDDFCPKDQVDQIQDSVIQILSGLLGGDDKLEVKVGYD